MTDAQLAVAALHVAVAALVVDVLILAWLVGTWFWEGHHKRCKVEVRCTDCGIRTETDCAHRVVGTLEPTKPWPRPERP